jgi:DNA-binding transcriptional regulator YhcF (GntR family)
MTALGLTLDRDADVPIGVQLAWALRARIRSGALPPGARLPALHAFARDLGVNPNTVRAVYARLEQDGLVATRHGSGTFVTGADAAAESGALAQLVSGAARAARDAGLDPRELAAALYVEGEDARRAPRADADERRRLRAEVAALERALSDLLARRPGLASQLTVEAPPRRPSQPRLPSTAELERQRTELLDRLVELHALMEHGPAEDPPDDEPPAPRPARAKQPARRSAAAKLRPAPRTA